MPVWHGRRHHPGDGALSLRRSAARGAWRERLEAISGFKIGIVWQGNPRIQQPGCRAADRKRSMPLAQFEPLARLPGVRLVSLQKGYGTEQLAERRGQETLAEHGETLAERGETLAERWGIVHLGDELHDFADTAAVMVNLDLVITADTSPAHLAGALGIPVWTPIPFAGCWRWLLARDDSPWYPTMRLFRQRRPGDWDEVFERLTRALAATVGACSGG